MSGPSSVSSATSKESSVRNGVSLSGGGATSGSQQADWVRRTNGVSSSNTPITSTSTNQSGPRRPSLSTTLTHHSRDYHSSVSTMSASATATPSSGYPFSHATTRDASNPYRYSKGEMLNTFETLEANGHLSDMTKISKLLLGENEKEGLFGGGAWGSKERNGNGTEACWDTSGSQRPVAFETMTSDEKELFQSVNSVQKPHQTPNTPGGPNSNTGIAGQPHQYETRHQPRQSTSASNLNTNYHKSNPSISSTGAPPPIGTASPTTRNRPRRDTGENNPFPPITRRRTDRNETDDPVALFDRFSGRSQSYSNLTSEDLRESEDTGGRPSARGIFKRQNSASWGVASPVTPGGSAQGAFANGAFGGIGNSFMLNSGVPVAKVEDKKFGGSIGRASGRSLMADKVDEENEDEEDQSRNMKTEDAERQAAYESSLQQLSKDSEADADLDRSQYGRRPGSTDTDPFNPRDSLPGDLDVDNPAKQRNSLGQTRQESTGFSNDGPSLPVGRNIIGTPTRNMGGGAFSGFGSLGVGSNVASPTSTRQGQHTPLSGFHPLQTQGQIGTGMSGSQGSEPLSPADTNPYQSPLPEAEDATNDDDSTGQMANINRLRPSGGSDRSQTSSAGIIGAGLPGLGGLGGFNNLGTPGLWSNPPMGFGNTQTAGGMGASLFGTPGETGLGTPGGASTAGFGATRASRLGQLFPAEQQQQLQQHQEQQRQHNRTLLQDDGGFDPDEAFKALRLSDNSRIDNRNSSDSLYGAATPGRLQGGNGDGSYFMSELEGQSGQVGQQIQSKASYPALTHSNSVSSLQQFPGTATPSGGAVGGSSQPSSQRNSAGHIMIMPDKISWVYKDPTAKIQGPFTGLEMHDWYKAGFFQQDLMIKRQEDGEFEALGQFIRRVGNSREPFLIPMQGPAFPPGHGWQQPNPWGQNTIDAAQGIVQPPFPGAFPSFGTTLTAEQQNALERRKQEEQYLMARQREYLVQQQHMVAKHLHNHTMGRPSHESLQHHPSQASLHSQPSLTSLQSPGGFVMPPATGPQASASFTELRHTTSNPSLDGFPGPSREEFGQHAFPGIPSGQGFGPPGAPQTPQTSREQAQVLERQRAQMARQYQNQHQMLERQRLQTLAQQQGNQGLVQGQQAGALPGDNTQLQVAGDDAIDITQDTGFDNDARAPDHFNGINLPIHTAHADLPQTQISNNNDEYDLFQKQHQLLIQQHEEQLRLQQQRYDEQGQLQYLPTDDYGVSHDLMQQQKQQSFDNESNIELDSAAQTQQESAVMSVIDLEGADESLGREKPSVPGRKTDRRIPTPPPPINTTTEQPKNPWGVVAQTGMPLPFPAPRSVTSPRPSTAQSTPKSPSLAPAETPTVSIAPWAKDPESASHSKGPSLKEIQELEAKQAAKAEAAALEVRRQEQAQQAALAAATAQVQPASGLPSSSNWATTPTATTNPSAWIKPLAKASTTTSGKKTLAQIQKEEEVRKQKAMAHAALQAATATPPTTQPVAPTRKSEWASKAAAAAPSGTPSSNLTGGAWTTVGAGGKKVGGPTAVTSPPRATPIASATATASTKGAKKPTMAALSSGTTAQKTAQDEFTKWCKINLKGLNSGVNVDDFLNMIMSFPLEVDLISDSVYQQSTTIDGRRFAEEFIRRRKLAQQGVVVDHGHADETKGGGWNEVAKKGREGSGSTASGPTDAGIGSSNFKVVQGKKKKR